MKLAMAFRSQFLKTVFVIMGLALAGQSAIALAGDGFMLATGRETGKSFAVGIGISSLAKVKLMPLHKMDLSPVESDGFVDNVRMLQRDEAQFAILQAMFGHFARTGTGSFAGETPNDDIQAIAMLWRDAEHFVIDEDYVKTGTIADIGELKGMPVSMGVDGPGPFESNRLLLSHFDVNVDDMFNLTHLNFEQSSQALQRGEIKAMSTPIRPPAPHIQEALSNSFNRYQLLEFTDDQITQADGGLGLWTPYVIPAATYPGQTEDIQTIAKSNLLVARKDVDPEVVYQVTKAVFENLDFLRNIHDAMYETSVDRALVGVPMPLHPGALRYFQEIGLLGPDASLEVAQAGTVRKAVHGFHPNGSLKASPDQSASGAEFQEASLTDALEGETGSEKEFVVYFDLGEEEINGEALQELAEVSAYADNLTSAKITIVGHTDRSGDPVFNDYLAEVRAKSVVKTLTATYGMAGHTVEIVNRGSEEPAIDDGREYQPHNRRVEITVVPADQAEEQVDAISTEDDDAAPAWEKRASI